MNTFLGVTTGLLAGVFAGIAGMSYLLFTDENLREFFEKGGKRLKKNEE